MWRKVQEADLVSSLSLKEVDAFRKSAEFEHDPVEKQIRGTCAYVRGCIRTDGAKVRMAREEDWLPESLIPPAMDYLRYNILTRMNVVVNESRTKSYDNAVALFDQLRRGDYVPESELADPEPTVDDPTEKATAPIAAPATPPHLLD